MIIEVCNYPISRVNRFWYIFFVVCSPHLLMHIHLLYRHPVFNRYILGFDADS